MSITEDFVLQGSWYALEQSGRLLLAAVTLYESGDHSTSLVVAMFGREELGRSRILRSLARRIASGENLDASAITRECEDHVIKHRAASGTAELRATPPSQLDEAMHSMAANHPQSEEWRRADSLVKASTDAKAKRSPDDRHRARMNSLYVDLDSSGASWVRPATTVGRVCACNEIRHAMGDYAQERDRLRDDVIREDWPDMARARDRMKPTPQLVEPRWPSIDAG